MKMHWLLPGVATLVALTPTTRAAAPVTLQAVADPVFVGAGDIADCSTTTDEATALLLDAIDGTVFTAGDNAYPLGRVVDFANCYEPTWGRHKTRTRPSPGNHDYYSPGAAPYYAYFGSHGGPANLGYYSYDLGAWHIVSLNSNIAVNAGSPQEQWLRADLAANQTSCTLAYWHHPLFSSGQHGNDPAMRDLWRALYDYGADVVVNGHDHNYEQFHRQNPDGIADVNGIRQFVVGTGGTSLRTIGVIKPNSAVRDATAHGVLKLILRPSSYDWEFVPIAGQTFTDVGSRPCVGTAPAQAGGRSFAVGAHPSGAEMVWTTGTAQTAYAIARIAGGTTSVLPGPGSYLPASATEYVDAAAVAGQFTCYLTLPLNASGVIGRSDVLCVVPRSRSSVGAPVNTRVQLDQSNMATVTWLPPGGQTGYLLRTIPLNGAPPANLPLPSVTTRVMHDTGGVATCYVVLPLNGGSVTGNSDVVCAVPGQATIAALASTSR